MSCPSPAFRAPQGDLTLCTRSHLRPVAELEMGVWVLIHGVSEFPAPTGSRARCSLGRMSQFTFSPAGWAVPSPGEAFLRSADGSSLRPRVAFPRGSLALVCGSSHSMEAASTPTFARITSVLPLLLGPSRDSGDNQTCSPPSQVW